MKPQLEIIVDQAGKTKVFRDGLEVELLRSVKFSASTEEVPEVEITQFLIDKREVELDACGFPNHGFVDKLATSLGGAVQEALAEQVEE